MSASELIEQARAVPIRRLSPTERDAVLKELRRKGLSWAEVKAWFTKQGLAVGPVASLKALHSRAMARERASAEKAAAEVAQ